jgi:hypothetical protein
LGWLRATEEQQGWRINRVFQTSFSGEVVKAGDLVVAVDGHRLTNFTPLSAAYLLHDIAGAAHTSDVVRSGQRVRLQFFGTGEPLLEDATLGAQWTRGAELHTKGSEAPSMSLPDESGKMQSMKYGPDWTLIHIWEPHCPPCFKDISALNEISNPPMPVLRLLAIVLGDQLAELQAIAKQHPVHFSNRIAGSFEDNPVTNAFDIFEVPMDVLVDPSGRVVFVAGGAGSLRSALEFFKQSNPR